MATTPPAPRSNVPESEAAKKAASMQKQWFPSANPRDALWMGVAGSALVGLAIDDAEWATFSDEHLYWTLCKIDDMLYLADIRKKDNELVLYDMLKSKWDNYKRRTAAAAQRVREAAVYARVITNNADYQRNRKPCKYETEKELFDKGWISEAPLPYLKRENINYCQDAAERIAAVKRKRPTYNGVPLTRGLQNNVLPPSKRRSSSHSAIQYF